MPSVEGIVSRAGLWAELDRVPPAPLTLVAAPAGFGKTTALAEWARRSKLRVAWWAVEGRDAEPRRFLVNLTRSLRGIAPGLLPGIESILTQTGPFDPIPALEDLLGSSMLEATPDWALIIDDLHGAGEEAANWARFVVELLPTGARMFVGTRTIPDWPLSLWLSRGQAHLVDETILRFSREETGALLSALSFPREKHQEIFEISRGWAALVRLLSLQKVHPSLPLDPGSREVLEFLAQEVYGQLSDRSQNAILRCCLVDELTLALVEALLDTKSPVSTMEELERQGALVSRVSRQPPVWTVHPLLREHLCRVAEERLGSEWTALHERLSEVFEREGSIDLALEATIQSRRPELTERLVETHALTAVGRSDLAAAQTMLRAVPEVRRRERPTLSITESWIELLSGTWTPAKSALLRSKEGTWSEVSTECIDHFAAIECLGTIDRANPASALARIVETLERLAPDSLIPTSVLALNAGTIAVNLSRDSLALELLDRADAAGRAGQCPFVVVAALASRANCLAARGRLTEVELLLESAFHYANRERCDELGLSGHLFLVRAALAFERFDAPACLESLEQAWVRARPLGEPFVLGYVARLRHRLARMTHRPTAESALRDLRRIAARSPLAFVSRWLEAAEEWQRPTRAKGLLDLSESPDRFGAEWHDVHLAQLASARAHGRDTLPDCELLLQHALRVGRRGDALDWLLAKGLALAREDPVSAVEVIASAHALARPEAHRRPFVEIRSELETLPLSEDIRAFAEISMPAKSHPPSMDAPSQRELEVLALLARGMSNSEIGARLFVSVGTVKTHVHSLLSKLDARNRVELVRRARERGVIS